MFDHGCFLQVSGSPRSSSYISLPLSSAFKKRKSTVHHLHSITIIVQRNAAVRGEGKEAQRLLALGSLQSLLVISVLLWKRKVWEAAIFRQTDRERERED